MSVCQNSKLGVSLNPKPDGFRGLELRVYDLGFGLFGPKGFGLGSHGASQGFILEHSTRCIVRTWPYRV